MIKKFIESKDQVFITVSVLKNSISTRLLMKTFNHFDQTRSTFSVRLYCIKN